VKRKRAKSGLTLVEILTVLAIIALLVGILIPAVTAVKDAAKNVKQTAQFTAIDIGLTAFKTDYGDYPPSTYTQAASSVSPPRPGIYCGTQRLCEALLGWDLLGFHPKSAWWWDGYDIDNGDLSYDPHRDRGTATFGERKKPYLESGTQYAFKLTDLFPTGIASIPPIGGGWDTYVLCDVFGATKVPLPDGTLVNAGAPILYYRADTSGKTISDVYVVGDNAMIVAAKEAEDQASDPLAYHPLADPAGGYGYFYDYIRDPKIPTEVKVWPYNPASYILISAGADGIYGTDDDIRNFGD